MKFLLLVNLHKQSIRLNSFNDKPAAFHAKDLFMSCDIARKSNRFVAKTSLMSSLTSVVKIIHNCVRKAILHCFKSESYEIDLGIESKRNCLLIIYPSA
ncbi:CLUMA_CG005869, isoform A [Clunio marinus]|uniref:CLUMA_CG005869, isoform A n=1 Tax=Clunio marinus TaxID=568069 RepID=A0A1J1HWD4_9DIPT|nr:CLUMA_CG005869, isoform A [Clunio marinus]